MKLLIAGGYGYNTQLIQVTEIEEFDERLFRVNRENYIELEPGDDLTAYEVIERLYECGRIQILAYSIRTRP